MEHGTAEESPSSNYLGRLLKIYPLMIKTARSCLHHHTHIDGCIAVTVDNCTPVTILSPHMHLDRAPEVKMLHMHEKTSKANHAPAKAGTWAFQRLAYMLSNDRKSHIAQCCNVAMLALRSFSAASPPTKVCTAKVKRTPRIHQRSVTHEICRLRGTPAVHTLVQGDAAKKLV